MKDQHSLQDVVNEQTLVRYKIALERIAHAQSPEEIRETDIGLDYEEHLEMAYENIIFEAMQALNSTF